MRSICCLSTATTFREFSNLGLLISFPFDDFYSRTSIIDFWILSITVLLIIPVSIYKKKKISYCPYWTETSLKLRPVRGVSHFNDIPSL